MPQKLTKMEINRVDLVDAGANVRRFAVFKRDESGDVPRETPIDEPGLLAKISKAVADVLRIPGAMPPPTEPVAKAQTFGELIAGREIAEALDDSWYTLQDAIWSAIYAVDDNGADLDMPAKQALIKKSLDEFAAYLISAMERGIVKRGSIAKVGRKISAAREKQLKDARDALDAVLAEAADDAEKTEKRATPEEDTTVAEITKKDLEDVVKAAIAPVTERLEALEKRSGSSEDEDEGVTLEGVAEAVGKLADRFDAIEKARGQRTAADGQDHSPVTKSSDKSFGIFG